MQHRLPFLRGASLLPLICLTASAWIVGSIFAAPMAADGSAELVQRQLVPPHNDAKEDDTAEHLPGKSTGANLTQYVDVFVGTAQNNDPGNVFAGATVPFGMAKVGLQIEGYAPAGYVSNYSSPTRGVSPLHDSGTGSSDGSYGNYCVMPVVCRNDDIQACPTLLDSRMRLRKKDGDRGVPGRFSTSLDNGIDIEFTSTRRASLERYTFPSDLLAASKSAPHLVLDWTNDGPGTFRGGSLKVDWMTGRIYMNGTWQSSFGPSQFRYRAYQCVDLQPPKTDGKRANGAIFAGDRFGMDAKNTSLTEWIRDGVANGQPIQAGVVAAFPHSSSQDKEGAQTVTIRRGLSFKSVERACENMESEIPNWDFDETAQQSSEMWESKLERIRLAKETDPYIKKLFYSSFYRAFLNPNNATEDGPFETKSPYFDGLYCSWDTYRTLHPLLSLSSPKEYAEIVETYIDGWRKEGWLPECRANQVKGFIQGGNHGVAILSDFASKYRFHASSLGVSLEDLWTSMAHDIDVPSPNFEYEGRQAIPYQQYGYLPFGYLDPVSIGLATREISRGLEYAYDDFTAAVAASTLLQSGLASKVTKDDVARYTRSALNYRLNYDPQAESDGFTTFVQQRFVNGTFRSTDPTICSPKDNSQTRECSFTQGNTNGVYESSSWEYSFYAPHDVDHLVELLGGRETFVKRLDHFFDQGYYQPGNEPSFGIPTYYHYVNAPFRSIRRVREVVRAYFNLKTDGIPGNDDNGAMASLVSWFLLGLFPVAGSRELLLLVPYMPSYTIRNPLLGDVTVKVTNFDPKAQSPTNELGKGVRAFVKSVTIDGKAHPSRCRIGWDELFPAAGGAPAAGGGAMPERTIEIEVTDEELGCGEGKEALPMSLSQGGFL